MANVQFDNSLVANDRRSGSAGGAIALNILALVLIIVPA